MLGKQEVIWSPRLTVNQEQLRSLLICRLVITDSVVPVGRNLRVNSSIAHSTRNE